MDIDEDGRIWVVEMPGYPLDVSPTGRVQAARGHQRRRPRRPEHPVCRQPAAAERRDALQEGHPRDQPAGPDLLRGRQRRRQGGHARGRPHRLCEDQPAARGEPPGVRPRQLDLPRPLGRLRAGDLSRAVRRQGHRPDVCGDARWQGARRQGPRRAPQAGRAQGRGALEPHAVRQRVRRVRPLLRAQQLDSPAPRGHRRAVSRTQSAPAAAERDGRDLRPRQQQHHADHARRPVRPADRGRASSRRRARSPSTPVARSPRASKAPPSLPSPCTTSCTATC